MLKNFALSFIFAASIFVVAQPAHALIEFRAGYGAVVPKDKDQELTNEVKAFAGWTGDLMFQPPLTGLSLGLRYESMGYEQTVLGLNYENSYDRLSAQLNYSLIDLVLLRLDLVAGVGLTEEMEFKSTTTNTYDDGNTFNLGGAARIGLGLISLTAEVGYHLGELKNSAGKIEVDGIYAKALVGFGF